MFPFDRLVRVVDELVEQGVISAPVMAQIGDGRYKPRHMPFERFMTKPQYDERVAASECVIAHAGAGTIQLALAYNKPLLVVPRSAKLKEHVNDHQLATARKFAELGHVLVSYDPADIAGKLGDLASFAPRPRTADRNRLAHRIGQFIAEADAARSSR